MSLHSQDTEALFRHSSSRPAKMLPYIIVALAVTHYVSCNGLRAEDLRTLNIQRRNAVPEAPQRAPEYSPTRAESVPGLPTNDTSICFPYFISQDVEALLAQASRMFSRATDDRQRGWLLLFIQRLDSLSKQLRSLPVQHKNMCFQRRQQILSHSDIPADAINPIPEDLQLHNAKRLFHSQGELKRNASKHYVTGKVSETFLPSNQRAIRGHYRPNSSVLGTLVPKQTQQESSTAEDGKEQSYRSKDGRGIPNHRDVPADSERSKDSRSLEAGFRIFQPLPVAYWHGHPMTEENIPFLPRSTRKTIPRPLMEKLKYQRDHSYTQAEEKRTNQQTTFNTVIPKTEVIAPSENAAPAKDSLPKATPEYSASTEHVPTVPAAASDASIAEEDKRSGGNEKARNKPEDSKTTRHRIITELPKSSYEDDELIAQLHSESSAKYLPSRMDSLLPENVGDNQQSGPFLQSEQQERSGVPSRQNGDAPSRQWNHELRYSENSGEPLVNDQQYIYDNNLDFDYEEQGAAAGELYSDDDSGLARNLAVPTSLQGIPKAGTAEQNEPLQDDEAVRQLQELKSSNPTENPDCPTNQTTVEDTKSTRQ